MSGLRVEEPINIIKKPEPAVQRINQNVRGGPQGRRTMDQDDSYEYESGEENEQGVGDFEEDQNDELGANILEGLKLKEKVVDV